MEILDNNSEESELYGKRSVEQVLNQGYSFDFGKNLSSAFQMFRDFMAPMIGWCILLLLGSIIILGIGMGGMYFTFFKEFIENPDTVHEQLPAFMKAILPRALVLSIILVLTISPLIAGVFLMFKHREQTGLVVFWKVFEGYTPKYFGKLIGLGFLTYLLTNIWSYLPLLIYWNDFESLFAQSGSIAGLDNAYQILNLAMYIPMIFLFVSYILAIPILLFQNLGVWDSMEASRKIVAKKFWFFLGYILVLGIIAYAGLLACCIGFLFSLPVMFYGLFSVYKDIFVTQAENSIASDQL